MIDTTLTDWKQNFRSLVHDTSRPITARAFTQHMMIHLAQCEDAMPPETCLLMGLPEGTSYADGSKRINGHLGAHGIRPA